MDRLELPIMSGYTSNIILIDYEMPPSFTGAYVGVKPPLRWLLDTNHLLANQDLARVIHQGYMGFIPLVKEIAKASTEELLTMVSAGEGTPEDYVRSTVSAWALGGKHRPEGVSESDWEKILHNLKGEGTLWCTKP